MQKIKIVIIGAGPAGLLLAHSLLAGENYEIEIYERRSDPRSQSKQTQRSFPVVLQSRGLAGIQRMNGLMSAVAAEGIWSRGSVLHRKRSEPRLVKRKSKSLIINRNRLTQVLLDELEKAYGDRYLSLHFNCNCRDVNLLDQSVTLNSFQDGEFIINFDHLVGADGAISQVRESLNHQNSLKSQQETVSDVYKSFSIPRISSDGKHELMENALHVWTLKRGVRLVMAPQQGDRLDGTLIFPLDRNPLANCPTGETTLNYIQDAAPILKSLMTLEDANILAQAPISSLTTVRCDRLNVDDKILLIGDAAHAVSPSIGQGCNSALQDVLIFSQVLDDYQQDWTRALPAFTERRLSEVHALRELSDYTFPRTPRMVAEFIFRITIGKKLHSRFPKLFSPLPMDLVMETDQSYSSILKQCQGWINRVRQSMGK